MLKLSMLANKGIIDILVEKSEREWNKFILYYVLLILFFRLFGHIFRKISVC